MNTEVQQASQSPTAAEVSVVEVKSSNDIKDWGEEVNGPLSPQALLRIEEFLGAKPKNSSSLFTNGVEVPSTFIFPIAGMSGETEFSIRIWQHGILYDSDAAVDLSVTTTEPSTSGLYCTPQTVTWVGVGSGALLFATEYGWLYKVWPRKVPNDEVRRFWVEASTLHNPTDAFAQCVPRKVRNMCKF